MKSWMTFETLNYYTKDRIYELRFLKFRARAQPFIGKPMNATTIEHLKEILKKEFPDLSPEISWNMETNTISVSFIDNINFTF